MSAQETVRPTFPTVADPPHPKLSYGIPFYEACARHVKETFNSKKPYVIVSKTLSEKTNFLKQFQDALGSSLVGTWFGIPNHTPLDSLIPIIHEMREKEADCLITLGGGSLSDGAKLISFALANNVKTVEDIMPLPRISDEGWLDTSYDNCNPPAIPVVCIPISLSGGEYSRYAGVTESETHFKYQFTHPEMFPSLVILDGNLTQSTPLSIWLASGVRSIDHCVEGFLSSNAVDEGNEAAIKALPELVNGLIKSKADPSDLNARLQCQLGSNLSMTLLYLGVRKGASHGIGHQLGPLGVAHGDTSCILLPAVCKYNSEINGNKQKILRDILLQQESVKPILRNAKVEESEADLGDILRAVFDHLGLPNSLKDVNIGEEKLDDLAQGCLKEGFVISNPKPIKTKEDVMEILRMVLK